MHVDMATSIARITKLQYLAQLSGESLERNIVSVAFQWHGVECKDFAEMLLDSCKRVLSHLIIYDHDVEKAAGLTVMCLNTVIDIQIDYSSLLYENAGLNEKVSSDCSELTAVYRLLHWGMVLILLWNQND